MFQTAATESVKIVAREKIYFSFCMRLFVWYFILIDFFLYIYWPDSIKLTFYLNYLS